MKKNENLISEWENFTDNARKLVIEYKRSTPDLVSTPSWKKSLEFHRASYVVCVVTSEGFNFDHISDLIFAVINSKPFLHSFAGIWQST